MESEAIGAGNGEASVTPIAPEASPKSNVFKTALKNLSSGTKKEKTSNILQSATTGFFGRKKASSNPPLFPGSVKQASFCGAQLPPVWATPPPAVKHLHPTDDTNAKSNDTTTVPGPRNAAGNLRSEQFAALLKSDKDSVDLERLRELSWGGVPVEFRPLVWKLLLSYVPAHKDRRDAMLTRKRSEYRDLLHQYYYIPDTDRGIKEQETLHQVLLDIEADSYWCLTKLLDDIQDHYTFSQPGLQRMVQRMEDLVRRCDGDLHGHIVETEQVQFVQFAFRWMNCLLMRECPLGAIVRLWDTYLCEESGFESFHVYVCAAILMTFGDQLKEMQFQDLVLFLQKLPTNEWAEDDIEPLLSRAYILQTYFADAPNHIPHK
ncbi:hypothetical protein DYB25_007674 [Aphanomyces astaci]|uniref:Rab-GAP TBC domain-containing protein n=2 Tax=Aphanomyces astaci TaxID=112090 RepID=A0A397BU26_APHAT|nr:hypothetical protein DYB25_007674 [Aphanomyces astaci]RHY50828.1 hypothetical protein DYB30_012611 [Aphanomyces astaci]RQM21460.1 hypothetical protein B5M09_009688 [Aphanomyces astaci]